MDLFIGLVAHFLKNFFIIILFFYFNNYFFNYFYFLIFFLSFLLPFLLSHVADRVLVLWPGVRPEPLKWER